MFSLAKWATQGIPGGQPNEDYVLAMPNLVAVFDGVTIPAGLESGCIHGTSWLVRRIAGHLAELANSDHRSMVDCVASAIDSTVQAHKDTCDLQHPGTPSTTVTALRLVGDQAEFFILADSPLVLDTGEVEAITDERVLQSSRAEREAALASGSAEERARRLAALSSNQRAFRNVEGGYWLASTRPEAAEHAITGTRSLSGDHRLTRAALLTDGASAGVEYGLTDWAGLLNELDKADPQEWINKVRHVEREDPFAVRFPRFKAHDDAAALYVELDRQAAS